MSLLSLFLKITDFTSSKTKMSTAEVKLYAIVT